MQNFFDQALSRLEQNEMISMEGVDARVAHICKEAQNAAPDDQRLYLPELTSLINHLNEYEKKLRAFQATLESGTSQGSDDGSTG